MKHVGKIVLAAAAAALLAACELGPAADPTPTFDHPPASHELVVANAHRVLTESLVDLSEALPYMTTSAEPEAPEG